MTGPVDVVTGKLRDHGCNPRQSRPGQWVARCPNTSAHRNGDRHPSLSVGEGPDGRALVHCATGCPTGDIVDALGLDLVDLFPDKPEPERRRIVARYPYTDAAGELLFEAVRYQPKGFAQRRPGPGGSWDWTIAGLPSRPLYRLPAILEAVATGRTIWIVEGEKDVEALVAVGECATCSPMGAGKWRDEHTAALAGARCVRIVADDDPAGHAHAQHVADALRPHVAHLAVQLPWPGCNDIAEHLGQGRSLDQLRRFEPVADPEPEPDVDEHGWEETDLGPVLDGTHRPPRPTLGIVRPAP